MSYQYVDESRRESEYALPDAEIFWNDGAFDNICPECGARAEDNGAKSIKSLSLLCTAADCGYGWDACDHAGYYYGFLDGGLDCFSSDPVGPFATEAEALDSARADAGFCEHGRDDETPCAECDGVLDAEGESR